MKRINARRLIVFHIVLPLVDHVDKILRQRRIKLNKFLSSRMNESYSLRVKRLARNNFKTIVDELFVLTKHGSLHNLATTIHFIVEDRVAEILHMCAYLMRATGFQSALD